MVLAAMLQTPAKPDVTLLWVHRLQHDALVLACVSSTAAVTLDVSSSSMKLGRQLCLLLVTKVCCIGHAAGAVAAGPTWRP
jgi:hypothetical protein